MTATSNENGQSTVSYTAPAIQWRVGHHRLHRHRHRHHDAGQRRPDGHDTASPTVVTGLTNGDAYTFTVTATNGVGTGPASAASAPATPATAPDPPTGVTAVATTSSTTASISWTAPANNGGATVTGYTVTSAPGSLTCTTTGATTCTVTGLTRGTTYTFTVTATNSAGTGTASDRVQLDHHRDARAPTGVTANATTVDHHGHHHAGPLRPTTVARPSPATRSPRHPAGSTAATTARHHLTVTGLTTRTSYTFTVTAKNANGTGPASAPSNSITVGAPGAPTIGAASATASATTATVTWTAPAVNGGAAVTGYTVTRTSPCGPAPQVLDGLTDRRPPRRSPG